MKTLISFLVVLFFIVTMSTTSKAQWTQIKGPYQISITHISTNDTSIIVGGSYDDTEIYRSTNDGIDWTNLSGNWGQSVDGDELRGLAVFELACFVAYCMDERQGRCSYHLDRSIDNGLSWHSTSSFPYPNEYVWDFGFTAFASSRKGFYAGAKGTEGGIFLSQDSGMTWSRVCDSLSNRNVLSIAVSSWGSLYAGTQGGVFVLDTNATFWTKRSSGLTDTCVTSLALLGNKLFAGTLTAGIFVSMDSGVSWTALNNGLSSQFVSSIAVKDTCIFAGTRGGIFFSTNQGLSWRDGSSSVIDSITAIVVHRSYIFALANGTVWRSGLSELMTAQNQGTEQPEIVSIRQNYPNPFNPETKIEFSLPNSSLVNLTIFDLLGREVAVLANEEKSAGKYTLQWDATGFPSGVYFYTVEAGSFRGTKRMMLIK